MKILKTLIATLLSLTLVLLPPGIWAWHVLAAPEAYADSFVGVLDEKFERLTETEGEKIVVVGGSSVAFGLDSAALERYTGRPVVNFGLYAALGTRLMLDLSLAGIAEGDIVVVAPEINPETLSLYFGAEATWRAVEGDLRMLRYISADNFPAMLGAFFPYGREKLQRLRSGETGALGDIYVASSFDEYCDLGNLPRPENIMQGYYDPNTPIPLDADAYGDELDEFLDYLNEYTKKCARRGARVYFSFSPMNSLALTEGSLDGCEGFLSLLDERLDCEIISDPRDYILAPGYFFDTNFHLGDAGTAVRTIRLGRDILLAEEITTRPVTDTEPEPPALPFFDVLFEGVDENADYFTFELRPDGSYAISGLSELGRAERELTVPLGYSGRRVTAILPSAFSGSQLEALVIGEDSYIDLLSNGAFLGASALRDIYIYRASGDSITPPASFAGTHPSLRVHVPEGSDFKLHYYWGERGLNFVFDLDPIE